jgi:hypothetical protein
MVRGSRHLRGVVLVLVVTAVVAASGCVKTPLPPVVSVGDPFVGPNPEVVRNPGVNTSVIRYGPWTVPAATGPGHHEAGMIENNYELATRKPCEDCYVTSFQPQLKYPDGAVANIDTGLWLHHWGLYVFGRPDPSCPAPLPTSLLGEHVFAGGNERSRALFPANTGFRIAPGEQWNLVYDFMNINTTPKAVVLEMTYEWVPATRAGMHAAKAWVPDVSPVCTEGRVPALTGQFSHKRTFGVTVPGRLLGIGAHLHTGGTRLTLKDATTGRMICDSKAYYGDPAFQEPTPGHGNHGHGMSHLSAVDQCVGTPERPLAVLERGQLVEIEAFYDGDAHPFDGSDGVMGSWFGFMLQ